MESVTVLKVNSNYAIFVTFRFFHVEICFSFSIVMITFINNKGKKNNHVVGYYCNV